MNYKTVTLEEKTVVGFSARTSNDSPDMGAVIGGLWQKLYYPENITRISGRTNDKALGIYTDYSSDEKGGYTVITGCEVNSDTDIAALSSEGFEIRKVPKGKYAEFIVKGNMITAVRKFWQELWNMNLDRSYVCDFEEYQNADPENAEIHIYIGLNG